MKLYIGCGPSPIHPQHLEILGDTTEWTFIDLYINEPHIKNWDGKTLDEVESNTVDEIYSSHTLEHFEHGVLQSVLSTWNDKLKAGGKLTINVPDLMWSLKRINKLEQGAFFNDYFYTYAGEHGILSVLYGSQSHEGEYHKSGFTRVFLQKLLEDAGYVDIEIEQIEDAHDMGVLIAVCRKSAS